jgi:hypothetical protein
VIAFLARYAEPLFLQYRDEPAPVYRS